MTSPISFEVACLASWAGALALTSSFARTRPRLTLALILVMLLDWQDWGTAPSPEHIPLWTLIAGMVSARSGWPVIQWPEQLTLGNPAWRKLAIGLFLLGLGMTAQKMAFTAEPWLFPETALRFNWLSPELIPGWLVLTAFALWCLTVRGYPGRAVMGASAILLLALDRYLHYGFSSLLPALTAGYLSLSMTGGRLSQLRLATLGVSCLLGAALLAPEPFSPVTLFQACCAFVLLLSTINSLGKAGLWAGFITGLLWLNPIYWLIRLTSEVWQWLDGPGPDYQV